MALGYRCKNSADFYPRPPRGGRPLCLAFHNNPFRFLSTPSARRATLITARPWYTNVYFYPRPPRGGRLAVKCINHFVICISIHALREEGDADNYEKVPTLSQISIHALREEGDVAKCYAWVGESKFLSTPSARRATSRSGGFVPNAYNFYPRPPRGGRLVQCTGLVQTVNFYPRPPRGGRLRNTSAVDDTESISIHALREEGD